MWSQKDEKDFWLHWLRVYREKKCLWDAETKRLSNRAERVAAYKELAELAKVVNPNADINFVRGRINAFRTCYRREFKKMEAARENGIDYKPQLFYFDVMKFTNIGDYPEDSIFDSDSQMGTENDDPISWEAKKEEVAKHMSSKKEAIKQNLNGLLEKRKRQSDQRDQSHVEQQESDIGFEKIDNIECADNSKVPSIASYPMPSSVTEDEYDIFGKRIAAHFRNMLPTQRLIAEKMISDICIYGRMQRLTLESNINLVENSNLQHSVLHQQQKIEDESVDYDDPDTYIYTN